MKRRHISELGDRFYMLHTCMLLQTVHMMDTLIFYFENLQNAKPQPFLLWE